MLRQFAPLRGGALLRRPARLSAPVAVGVAQRALSAGAAVQPFAGQGTRAASTAIAGSSSRIDARGVGLVTRWDDAYYGVSLPDPVAAENLLMAPGVLWDAVVRDAQAAGEAPADYLARVLQQTDDSLEKLEADGVRRVINHEVAMAALRDLGRLRGKLVLLSGPRSVGKSLMLEKVATGLAQQRRRVLYVDARLHGTNMTAGILSAIAADADFTTCFIEHGKALFGQVLPAALSTIDGSLPVPVPSQLLSALWDITADNRRQALSEVLCALIAACEARGEYPVLFFDEANKAFKAAQGDAAAAARVLDELHLFTRVTKQEKQASVVLASSEHDLHIRLRALGFNTGHIGKTIIAEEVPPAAMKAEVTRNWGCGEHLATALLAMYGGHVLTASAAVCELATSLDPAAVTGLAAVGSVGGAPELCLDTETFAAAGVPRSDWEDMRARVTAALRALVETGYVPLASEEDKVAEILCAAHAGWVIPRSANASGVPPAAWKARTPSGVLPKHLLVPASHTLRLLMACKRFPPKAQV